MKTFSKWMLPALAVVLTFTLLNSCKKGEDDPWFSFYSRKSRLCQDWKITSYKRTEMLNSNIIAYTFDGSTYRKIGSNYTYSSPGTMKISFSKTGAYKWEQSIANDTSTYIYSESGNWYFTGGGKDTDTKNKELIGLQREDFTESFSSTAINTSVSFYGSGDLETNIYRLQKLASDEVVIVSEATTSYTSDTDNNIKKITTEIILEPLK